LGSNHEIVSEAALWLEVYCQDNNQ
jgi:hypothetical protein